MGIIFMRYAKLVLILGFAFISMFLANAAIMYNLFGINVLKAGFLHGISKTGQFYANEFVDDTAHEQRKSASVNEVGHINSSRGDIGHLCGGYTDDARGFSEGSGYPDTNSDSTQDNQSGSAPGIHQSNGSGFVNSGTVKDFSEGTGNSGAASGTDEYYMTAEELEFIKGRLGLREKISAMAIISRMDKDVIDQISRLARNGITMEEFEIISRAVEQYLTEDEREEILKVLGKNRQLYAESKK